jgi:hypothetical protein
MHALVHSADIQDRDGGGLVLTTLFGMFPFLKKLFADGGYQRRKVRAAQKKALPFLTTEIVKRSDHANGFEVLPRRWVVERTFAWLARCRGSQKIGRTSIKRHSRSYDWRNPAHAAKAMQPNMMFPIRLLDARTVAALTVIKDRLHRGDGLKKFELRARRVACCASAQCED